LQELKKMQLLVAQVWLNVHKEEWDAEGWAVSSLERESPQQPNGYDCGVVVIELMRHLTLQARWWGNTTEQRMRDARDQISLAILHGLCVY